MSGVPEDLLKPDQEPTGELPLGVTTSDGPALEELAAAGWGEGDGEDAGLPDGYWDTTDEVDS